MKCWGNMTETDSSLSGLSFTFYEISFSGGGGGGGGESTAFTSLKPGNSS